MGCQYYAPTPDGAQSYSFHLPKFNFGRGILAECADHAVEMELKRVAVFTDPGLRNGSLVGIVTEALRKASIEFDVFCDIRIEPCDQSVANGAKFLGQGNFDGMISVGGGSVMDTAKGALVVHAHGGSIVDYMAPPVGQGKAIPSRLLPHIACPTTAGTGSECTPISVIRVLELDTKFVACHKHMMPDVAIVDPQCCDSLPQKVLASTGFDLLSHALECFTARAYTGHAQVQPATSRVPIQGANPFSDMAAREALKLSGQYMVDAVSERDNQHARDQMSWASTLAGMAFGNAGTHLPHALSYGVTHLMKDITTDGYNVPDPFVPHGISVIVTSPSVFRYTASATPERHMKAATLLQADSQGAATDDAGEVLAKRLIELMRATGIPNGLAGVGFGEQHVKALADSAVRQKRAITNAPRDTNLVDIENIYQQAISYW